MVLLFTPIPEYKTNTLFMSYIFALFPNGPYKENAQFIKYTFAKLLLIATVIKII